MANYVFEVNSLSQYSCVIDSLKSLDRKIIVQEAKDISPYVLDIRVKIQIEATLDEIAYKLQETGNAQMPLKTIRPVSIA